MSKDAVYWYPGKPGVRDPNRLTRRERRQWKKDATSPEAREISRSIDLLASEVAELREVIAASLSAGHGHAEKITEALQEVAHELRHLPETADEYNTEKKEKSK